MWYDAMAAIQKYLPAENFVQPVRLDRRSDSERVSVPSVVGMTVKQAVQTLEAAGFQVTVAGAVYSDDVPKGLVALTSPLASSQLDEGSTVTVYVSAGPASTGNGGGGGGTGGGGGGSPDPSPTNPGNGNGRGPNH